MPTKEPPQPSAMKHRACDECRQRKLACSKDPDGCDRCRREHIACQYSEQKPMGRPRKRQFIETIDEEHLSNQIRDQSLPFIDDPDIYNEYSTAEPFPTSVRDSAQLHPEVVTGPESKLDPGAAVWLFGRNEIMAGPPIDFGNIGFGSGENTIPPLDYLPQPSTISNSSISESENSDPPSVASPCICLASMYLSLAALQQFPTDIVAALKTVRGAAATAAQSLWCPQCGSVLLDTAVPPIEAFQNTMLLGTILPIIANGYWKLLKMIDDETDAATVAGEMKMFRFHDYGGLGGCRGNIENETTDAPDDCFSKPVEMVPAQWRSTVRALLRIDIYGHEQPSFTHKGLKDLVSEMEYRQRTRHDMLDAHEAAGTLNISNLWQGLFQNQNPSYSQCAGERPRGCLEILKIAKMAIDNIIIA